MKIYLLILTIALHSFELGWYIFTIFLHFISFKKLSLIIFLINFIFITFISFFPIGSYLTYNIEKEFHSNIKIPERVDGILILGGATNPLLFKEYDQISLNGSAERLVESVLIIRKFEKAKVIFSGGSGSINRSDLDHSQVAKLFYKNMNVKSICEAPYHNYRTSGLPPLHIASSSDSSSCPSLYLLSAILCFLCL